mgnify:CR=1 FL=1
MAPALRWTSPIERRFGHTLHFLFKQRWGTVNVSTDAALHQFPRTSGKHTSVSRTTDSYDTFPGFSDKWKQQKKPGGQHTQHNHSHREGARPFSGKA